MINQITYKIRRHLPMLMSVLGLTLIISACVFGNHVSKKPDSAGKSDEVLWVMNENFWEDTIGTTIKQVMLKSYDVLPQMEAQYFMREKNFQQFNNDIIKRYRNIVICISREDDVIYSELEELLLAIGASDSNKALIMKDVWATPQIVAIIVADNKEQLAELIESNIQGIEATIREQEDTRINHKLYDLTPNVAAEDSIQKYFDFKLDIPGNYFVGIQKDDFFWIRHETYTLSSNILIYKRQLTKDELRAGVDWKQFAIDMRNYLGKTYIATRVEGSYMIIEEKFAPVLQQEVNVMENYGIETKGLWKMKKDFMGGAFTNLCWFDETTSTFYMIDGYVHAPKEGKKKYMRDLAWIMDTLRPMDSGDSKQ